MGLLGKLFVLSLGLISLESRACGPRTIVIDQDLGVRLTSHMLTVNEQPKYFFESCHLYEDQMRQWGAKCFSQNQDATIEIPRKNGPPLRLEILLIQRDPRFRRGFLKLHSDSGVADRFFSWNLGVSGGICGPEETTQSRLSSLLLGSDD